MNINELDSYNLLDAINFHSELNPQLFVGDELRPPVRTKLLEIAQDFIQFIGITDIALVDITLSGSNAAYSYTPYSDIDLHLIVDFNQLSNDEIFRELFDAKKYQYNDQHDIKIKGYDVEVYVQAADQAHSSLGEYSINRNDWNKIPTKRRANLDDTATKLKYEKLRQLALQALAADDLSYLNNVLDVIKRYRRAGLTAGGEFSPENLAFKVLRQQGLFKKLWDKKYDHEDKILSLEDNDIHEFNYMDNSQQIAETIKHMYKKNPTLFDRYTFETVYKGAAKLVEDGRIVKGVNTTDDVGIDQISIEAEKIGFKVSRDGRPPLLRESAELFEDDALYELNMSPGALKGEVNKILQKYTPMVGVELEVCWEREGSSDFEGDTGPEIDNNTSWDEIESFFEHNAESDFKGIMGDYEEWLMDQSNEWVAEKVHEATGHPGVDVEQKLDIITDYTDYSRDEANKIIEKAEETYEKFGDANEWDMVDDLSDEAQLYHSVFVDGDAADDVREKLNDHYIADFFEGELPWDDEKWTLGAWLLNHKGYRNMQELFWDYSDDLYWPGGSITDQPYDLDVAVSIVDDLKKKGIVAKAQDEYHSDRGEFWAIEPDESIQPNEGDVGFEIISPPMDYVNGLEQLGIVFNYLKSNNAYSNESTGFHINVSIQGVDHSKVDYTKLVLLIGDQYILSKFDRMFNTYAVSSMKKLGEILSSSNAWDKNEFSEFVDSLRNKVNNAVQDKFASSVLNLGKYVSVHLKDDYIEFRSAGGESYLNMPFEEVQNLINRFIVAYAVAADPEAYKKDYAKKLYKLIGDKITSKSATGSEIMKIFSLYSTGVIDKATLVQKIKELKKTKPAARKVEVKLDVSEYPILVRELKAIHNISLQQAATIIRRAVEWENAHNNEYYTKLKDEKQAKEVLKKTVMQNLENNLHHYD